MQKQIPVSTDSHLWISWDDYHRAIESLALTIDASGWKFDQVLCLARGGMRPGDILSRLFDVPLAILSTSSYRDESGTVRGELNVAQNITMAQGSLSGNVLLVDDLVDSGVTLAKVQDLLKQNFSAIIELKSAVIWCKACASLKPDFCFAYLNTSPWIHQPFEGYDSLRPSQLAALMKKNGAE